MTERFELRAQELSRLIRTEIPIDVTFGGGLLRLERNEFNQRAIDWIVEQRDLSAGRLFWDGDGAGI